MLCKMHKNKKKYKTILVIALLLMMAASMSSMNERKFMQLTGFFVRSACHYHKKQNKKQTGSRHEDKGSYFTLKGFIL